MDRFSINLKMKASDAFKDGELTPEQEETLEEEEKEAMIKSLKFPWHCESKSQYCFNGAKNG